MPTNNPDQAIDERLDNLILEIHARMPADGIDGWSDAYLTDESRKYNLEEKQIETLRPLVLRASKLAFQSEKYKRAVGGRSVKYRESDGKGRLLKFVAQTQQYRHEVRLDPRRLREMDKRMDQID